MKCTLNTYKHTTNTIVTLTLGNMLIKRMGKVALPIHVLPSEFIGQFIIGDVGMRQRRVITFLNIVPFHYDIFTLSIELGAIASGG